ncbi:MAG TPA: hypothetical protein ENJ60_04355 [Aeromonadales bacterium]|nr:hypothetical protein [Aeromonadales bacterium]
MALIQCPVCKKRVSSRAAQCSHCGAPIASQDDEQTERAEARNRWKLNRRLQNISFVMLLFFLLGFLLFWYNKSDPTGWKYILGQFAMAVGFVGYSVVRIYKLVKK